MKKRWFILIMIMIMLFLTGCNRVPEPVVPLPEEGYDTTGEKTVVYHADTTFPLSFTLDGEQQIKPGTYWYYELAAAYDKSWQDSFYTYDTKSLELNGNKSYTKLGKRSCYATNGDWPLFLNPVHTEYTPSNQEMVDQTIATLAQQQLDQHQMALRAQITDVWTCDLDGDGTQETFFKASNGAEQEEAMPSYCFLAYLKGDRCQILYSVFRPEGDLSVEKLTPLVCDLNGDGKWGVVLYQKGDYESFTAFDYTAGSFVQTYQILF
ncbi:MAG: hypothetical protein IJD09_01695 [Clostridia bacterium]|nr:hypothetical protein [Clostridia bacterium]